MKTWYKYIKPYLPYFILGPLCMIIEVIGEVLMPKFLAIVINGAENDTLDVGGSVSTAGLMILTAVLMMVGGVGGAYFGAKASINFAADLRNDAFKKVQTFSFANIDKFSTGSLVTRLTNDVTQLQNFVNMLLRMCLRSPGMLIGGVIMAVSMRPDLSLVLLVTIPLMLVSILFIISKGFKRFERMQTKIDNVNNNVQENLTNVRVVKSFVRENYENKKFFEVNGDLKQAGMSAMKVMIFMGPVMTVFMNITTLSVLWFGANIILGEAGTIGGMAIGDLSAFLTYVTQILSSLMMVTMMLMTSSRALASARRIKEVLYEESDIDDANALYPDLAVTKGDIEFKGVSFKYYKNSEEQVLDNINLRISAGQTVGIIGSTGCGKTTLISMIPRLYDVDCGEVLVDGINVKDYSLYNLREGVGVVLQKNVLFSGTIENNLRWGNDEATDEELRTAAEYAQAHGFIESFKEGYNTELEQGGVNVSGGQKQRLCIARALLKKPKILILDDSTSAVDTATEAMIRKAFKEELAGSTKIIIAQRISSVRDCDSIIVMNEGKITGVGSHEELLKTCTEYEEIYLSQADRKEEA
ncbi:MAG: ABC transporter ATP-binding protein [Acutalibacteraceae bacterium]|nr:ABC transporter ATP-binding protein [Acutalibacteraceae bacterium]